MRLGVPQPREKILSSESCVRSAAVVPKLPNEIILNMKHVPDEEARVTLTQLEVPFIINSIPVKALRGGYQSKFYAGQIQRMAKGLRPIDTRL